MGVALHWALLANDQATPPDGHNELQSNTLPPSIAASLLASISTKRAAEKAFAKKGRSTTTPDLLEALGAALYSLESDL